MAYQFNEPSMHMNCKGSSPDRQSTLVWPQPRERGRSVPQVIDINDDDSDCEEEQEDAAAVDDSTISPITMPSLLSLAGETMTTINSDDVSPIKKSRLNSRQVSAVRF